MSTPITMRQALDMIKNTDNPIALMNNEQMLELTRTIHDAGQGILRPLIEDEPEYVNGLISFTIASVISELLSRATEPEEIVSILGLTQSELFRSIIAFALKYSIGLTISEELR